MARPHSYSSLSPTFVFIILAIIAGCKENPAGSGENPLPPINFRCYGVGTASGFDAMAIWNAPADSALVTGYTVYWHDDSSAVTDSATVDATARSYRMTGLTGLHYTISVAARHANSVSVKAAVEWTRPAFLAIPDSLSVTFVGSSIARLRWQAASDPAITGHAVSWKADRPGLDGARALLVPATTIEIPNIDCSAHYSFSVRSIRGSDTSAPLVVDTVNSYVPPPSDLQATPLGDGRVSLKWARPADTGSTRYIVSWTAVGASLSGSDTVPDLSAAVGVAQPNIYDVTVRALRCTHASAPIALQCASAARFGNDIATPVRVYEPASSKGCGLVLDPERGGPKTVSVKSSNPALGDVQLALYTTAADPNSFVFGPAAAIAEFLNADLFDHNTYISDSSYFIRSLDAWYLSGPFDNRISPIGNTLSFIVPVASKNGFGFYVRTGTAGSRHYARVAIRSTDSLLLQGTAPDRYVDLEISYQTRSELPFAKPAATAPVVGTAAARRR